MIFDGIVLFAVAFWLLATCFAQIEMFSGAINRHDPFGLIPRWTFFAPNPGVHDYHLVVRDQDRDGVESAWKAVTIGQDRNIWSTFWNPGKRAKKIVNDAFQAIKVLRARPEVGSQGLPLSLPYLLLLHYSIQKEPPSSSAVRRQFAVVASSGHSSRELVGAYFSEYHNL